MLSDTQDALSRDNLTPHVTLTHPTKLAQPEEKSISPNILIVAFGGGHQEGHFGWPDCCQEANSELPISVDFTVFRSNVRLVHRIDRLFTSVSGCRP